MPNENDRRTFTIEDAKNIPLDVLKNSYFFLDQDLTLRRLTTETRPGTGDIKGAVNTHTIEDVVVISRDTKGKLLELTTIDDDDLWIGRVQSDAKVQFDNKESCSLMFSYTKFGEKEASDCKFKIINVSEDPRSINVKYNGNLYSVDTTAGKNRCLEFQLRETTETVTTKAKGAW